MTNKTKTITFFHRKPRPGNFSVETLFKEIRNEVSKQYNCRYHESKYYSNGFIKRFLIALDFAFNQGDVNHITGDINFANIFLRKNKTVSTILDVNRLKQISKFRKLVLVYFWIKLPIKRSRFVTTISNSAKQEILSYTNCDPDKIKVIYVQRKSIFKKSEKLFNHEKPVILQVGTKANKNIERLIIALKDIKCQLHIVGTLNDEQSKLLEDNKIDYRNFKNLTEQEIYEKYVMSDILSFVSTYEGFGMPIVEANAVGRPVVTSNVSSLPEVAEDAALLVNPLNTNEIRDAFIEIIENKDLRADLVKKGYDNAKRFDLDSIVERYLNIYDQILNN